MKLFVLLVVALLAVGCHLAILGGSPAADDARCGAATCPGGYSCYSSYGVEPHCEADGTPPTSWASRRPRDSGAE